MPHEKIPFLDLQAENGRLIPSIREAMDRVMGQGAFILGPEVTQFESEIAEYLGVSHAVGVSSGTDALLVALMELGIGDGDEVVTTPFSFFATAGCIARLGAKPVFVDIEPNTFNIDCTLVDNAITERTRAILPVHLFGQPCDMKTLKDIALRRGVPIVEDAAQAVGARVNEGPIGALGVFGCFSFFPSKNLGGFGDGGLVTTQDGARAERIRILRAHGSNPKYFHKVIGGNFRLDALQAAVLRVKLPHLEHWTQARRANAARYNTLFREAGLTPGPIRTPEVIEKGHVYNQYVIRVEKRDDLQKHLHSQGIETAIYYPLPLHVQECFSYLDYKHGSLPKAEQASSEVLALPVYPELGTDRQERIVSAIKGFFTR
jgi:dTDP-4-amino-4,6-dideoxygalactose transaminase